MWIGHLMRINLRIIVVIEGKVEGKTGRGILLFTEQVTEDAGIKS